MNISQLMSGEVTAKDLKKYLSDEESQKLEHVLSITHVFEMYNSSNKNARKCGGLLLATWYANVIPVETIDKLIQHFPESVRTPELLERVTQLPELDEKSIFQLYASYEHRAHVAAKVLIKHLIPLDIKKLLRMIRDYYEHSDIDEHIVASIKSSDVILQTNLREQVERFIEKNAQPLGDPEFILMLRREFDLPDQS